MNKNAGLNGLRIFLFVFTISLLLSFTIVQADVISINPSGSNEHVANPNKYIEGFFFGENSIPYISNVFINASSPNNLTGDHLFCNAILLDGDLNEIMNVSVRWYKNGELNLTLEYEENYVNETIFSSSLLFGNTSKGEEWMCSLRSYDGKEYSEWYNSSNLSIENTAPNIPTLISPPNGNITTNRTPSFYWNGSDIDGDTLTYELSLTCYNSLGGGCSDDNRLISGISEENKTLSNYLEYLKDNDYYYNWSVRAYDGVYYSLWASPWKLEIQASLDVILINDTINFESIERDESKNTTLNEPYPFSLQNDGNCFANVSINATQLWNTIPSDSNSYQFKADNYTQENGSFDWLSSKFSWTQMPITGQTIAISKFNFNDTQDVVEVDVLVTVPNQEPAGDRQSTVYFPISLGE